LDAISYEERYGRRQLTILFDNSGWYGAIECCFEGLLALNLRPYKENESRELWGATLLIQNETVFWADVEELTEELNDQYNDQYSYVKALNLKWRKLEI